MTIVLLATVIWVTLTLVVVGACVAAARGDRAVIDDALTLPPFGSGAPVSPATSTPIVGASRSVAVALPTDRFAPRGRRTRGAHARPRPSQLARR